MTSFNIISDTFFMVLSYFSLLYIVVFMRIFGMNYVVINVFLVRLSWILSIIGLFFDYLLVSLLLELAY